MVGIIALIIGIVGFAKGRIGVSKARELRGSGMYLVATLFCLPLPLSLLVGLVLGAINAGRPTPLEPSKILLAGALCTWVPILAGVVLAFVLSKPKEAPPAGFPVTPGRHPPQAAPPLPDRPPQP
ncbi:MAG TPA: hypothetical protein VGI81_14250 [Tepidisphaeraceae bacterium]|jgi:hypothetical protein